MSPKLLSAASRASSGVIPRPILACVSISTWERSSSSMSCRTASLRSKPRSRARTRLSHFIARSLRSLAHLRDGQGEPVPARLLDLELLPPGPGQRVELGPAARLVHPPLGGDPALLLDPGECRVECALLDREHLAGHLAQTLDDAVAVQRPEAEGPEDEHVERALEQVGFRVGHGVPPGAYAEMGACLNTLGMVE